MDALPVMELVVELVVELLLELVIELEVPLCPCLIVGNLNAHSFNSHFGSAQPSKSPWE